MNLDPAVMTLPFGANIDIRDTVHYKEVMKQFNLGPNGGILTSLNLFATKFDEVKYWLPCRFQLFDDINSFSFCMLALLSKWVKFSTSIVFVLWLCIRWIIINFVMLGHTSNWEASRWAWLCSCGHPWSDWDLHLVCLWCNHYWSLCFNFSNCDCVCGWYASCRESKYFHEQHALCLQHPL